MKKFLSILMLIGCICSCVNAKEASTVCASHILVPTEMDAIKLKSQIKNFDDFKCKVIKIMTENACHNFNFFHLPDSR